MKFVMLTGSLKKKTKSHVAPLAVPGRALGGEQAVQQPMRCEADGGRAELWDHPLQQRPTALGPGARRTAQRHRKQNARQGLEPGAGCAPVIYPIPALQAISYQWLKAVHSFGVENGHFLGLPTSKPNPPFGGSQAFCAPACP